MADTTNASPAERLLAIEKRCDEATPGKWVSDDASGDVRREDGRPLAAVVVFRADRDFIAHAREDVPWLISEVRRLQPATDEADDCDHENATAERLFYIDTEFSELGGAEPIRLLSIGIKAADGRTFYAVNEDWRIIPVNEWVLNNVLPHLLERSPLVASPSVIAEAILDFIGDVKPEFWGYYADYDWVALCQLFGSMVDLPKGWPMYCRDLKQLCDSLGNPRLTSQASTEHHALSDAEWNADAHAYLLAELRRLSASVSDAEVEAAIKAHWTVLYDDNGLEKNAIRAALEAAHQARGRE
jgi:3' exoribonuclease, RNase T-like